MLCVLARRWTSSRTPCMDCTCFACADVRKYLFPHTFCKYAGWRGKGDSVKGRISEGRTGRGDRRTCANCHVFQVVGWFMPGASGEPQSFSCQICVVTQKYSHKVQICVLASIMTYWNGESRVGSHDLQGDGHRGKVGPSNLSIFFSTMSVVCLGHGPARQV